MNKKKPFLGWCQIYDNKNLKIILSVFIVALFLILPFNNASSVSITEKKEDSCALCIQTNSKEDIYFDDLSEDKKLGIIVFVLLYMMFEEENEYFDSLNNQAKTQYLDNLVTNEQLLDILTDEEFLKAIKNSGDEEIKENIYSVLTMSNRYTLNTETIQYNPEQISQPSEPPYNAYEPRACLEFLATPMKNFYNNYIKDALSALGYVLTGIVLPAIVTIAKEIIDITPYPGILISSIVAGDLAKAGYWIINNLVPIILFIASHGWIAVLKAISIILFTTWVVLLVFHIICKILICPEANSVDKNNMFERLKLFSKDFFQSFYSFLSGRLKSFNSNEVNIITQVNDNPSDPHITNFRFLGPLNNEFSAVKKQDFSIVANYPTDKSQSSSYISAMNQDEVRLFYIIYWDDNTDTGWKGPYQSGEVYSTSHEWTVPETYTVTGYAELRQNEEVLDSKSESITYKVIKDDSLYLRRNIPVLNRFIKSDLLSYLNSLNIYRIFPAASPSILAWS